MGALQYVHVDVYSDVAGTCMFYDTYHSYMNATQYVQAHVTSSYFY